MTVNSRGAAGNSSARSGDGAAAAAGVMDAAATDFRLGALWRFGAAVDEALDLGFGVRFGACGLTDFAERRFCLLLPTSNNLLVGIVIVMRERDRAC